MATTLDQLNQAIQQLTTTQEQLVQDISTLVVKLPKEVDYTNELTSINASIAALQNADATLKAAMPAEPPAATLEPAEEQPAV